MGAIGNFFNKIFMVQDDEDELEMEEAYTAEPAVRTRKRFREEESVENIRPERKVFRAAGTSADEGERFNDRAAERRSSRSQSKIVPIRSASAEGADIKVCKPTSFEDSLELCNLLKSGYALIVNLEGADKDGQRIMDFLSGSVYALEGNATQISQCVFAIVPKNVDISGDYLESFDIMDFHGLDDNF